MGITLKYLKNKLLFCLFAAREAGKFNSCDYKFLYFRTSEFDPVSIRSAVKQLVAEGLVDRVRRNRRSWLRLTASGRHVLFSYLPFLAGNLLWKKHWTLVILLNRSGEAYRALQRELARIGCRHYTRGVYLSPFADAGLTREMLLKNHWGSQAIVVESRQILGVENQQLARTLWPLEEIAERYQSFITLADRLIKISRSNLVLLQQAKFGFKAVFDAYFQLLLIDPALPRPLLASDWPGDTAGELFWRLVAMAKTAKI